MYARLNTYEASTCLRLSLIPFGSTATAIRTASCMYEIRVLFRMCVQGENAAKGRACVLRATVM